MYTASLARDFFTWIFSLSLLERLKRKALSSAIYSFAFLGIYTEMKPPKTTFNLVQMMKRRESLQRMSFGWPKDCPLLFLLKSKRNFFFWKPSVVIISAIFGRNCLRQPKGSSSNDKRLEYIYSRSYSSGYS